MNNHKNIGTDLVNLALEAFRMETGLQVEYSQENPLPLERYLDGLLHIGEGDKQRALNVEIKTTINEVILGRLAQHVKVNPDNNILITRYTPPYLAKKMKEMQIQFIDTAGNAYINRPPVFVYIYGNKTIEQHPEKTTEVMFGVGGIRVLFALLCKQDLEKGTYREIADAAGVALGTVAGVMKNLAEHHYLIELADRGRTLVKKKELVEKWTDVYTAKYRQRRFIGRYAAPREQFWRDTILDSTKALWGGEVAAQKLTHYLKPEIITIYTRKPIDELAMNLKLRKDEKGLIELREQFWNFEIIGDNKNSVPPLLVYADLMALGDARTLEAATMVNDEYLKRHFQ